MPAGARAAVIATRESFPRKAGAGMLVRADGSTVEEIAASVAEELLRSSRGAQNSD